MSARILHFPHRHRAPVVPFRPRFQTPVSPADPELCSAVHAVTRAGHITGQTNQLIQRALVCPDPEVWEARIGAVYAVGYETGWADPDAAHVMALVLLEVCPGFTPFLLHRFFQLADRAQTHVRDAVAAVALAEMRVIAEQLVTGIGQGPGAA